MSGYAPSPLIGGRSAISNDPIVGSSASRDSGHATSPSLGGIHFGSGELAPLRRSGSGAETDRRVSSVSQPCSRRSASRISNQAYATQKQLRRQAEGYVPQAPGSEAGHVRCKPRGGPPHNGVNSARHEAADLAVDLRLRTATDPESAPRPSPPALQRRQVVSPPALCPGKERENRDGDPKTPRQ